MEKSIQDVAWQYQLHPSAWTFARKFEGNYRILQSAKRKCAVNR